MVDLHVHLFFKLNIENLALRIFKPEDGKLTINPEDSGGSNNEGGPVVFSGQEESQRSNTKGGLVLTPGHGTTLPLVDSTSDQDINN